MFIPRTLPLYPLPLYLSLILGLATPPARAQDTPPPLPSVEMLEALLQGYDVPGASVAYLGGCETGATQIAGSASLDPAVPVTDSTVFEAASLSKPVFAYLVMSLVDEGVVDLDEALAKTFDYERVPDKAAYAKLTPRMILTHRTGMPNWVGGEVDFAARTTPIPFDSVPGTAYTYSGEAFQLLQAYVEAKTDQTLEQLFRERLGEVMPLSTFTDPPVPGTVPTRGYQRASEPADNRPLGYLTTGGMSASSLITTATDYANFLNHLCKREGLRPETYAEMFRPQSPIPRELSPFPASYGLGWVIADIDGETFATHSGNNDEYRAFAGFMLDGGEGLVAFTNGARGEDFLNVLITPPAPPPAGLSAPETVFEQFWRLFDEEYALFDVKGVDWDALYAVYRPQVTPATTDAELWTVLSGMAGLLNDLHVKIEDPETGDSFRSGGRSIGVGPFDDGRFSARLVDTAYVLAGLTDVADETIHFGWLPDSLGYLRISRFGDPAAAAAGMDTALAQLHTARGLVLDLRQNGGGLDLTGRTIGDRLTGDEVSYMTVVLRKFGSPSLDFGVPVTWRLRPAGPRQYTGPIAALTDSRSISATENFALALRALPHATLVGETTAGAMADAAPRPLANGWQVSVPINVMRDTSGVSYEGVGIAPDLYLANDAEDVAAGKDRILEFAQDLLRTRSSEPQD